ncbi:hypothetical protein D3C84_1214810 [compost metagenome]
MHQFAGDLALQQFDIRTLWDNGDTLLHHRGEVVGQFLLLLFIGAIGVLTDRPWKTEALAKFAEEFEAAVFEHIGPEAAAV